MANLDSELLPRDRTPGHCGLSLLLPQMHTSMIRRAKGKVRMANNNNLAKVRMASNKAKGAMANNNSLAKVRMAKAEDMAKVEETNHPRRKASWTR